MTPPPQHDGIPTGKIPMRRAFPAPRRPHVAPSEVLLGKGLPLRSCTSASRARGAYKLKRLGPHSPIIGFHYRSDQPRRRHTDRLLETSLRPRSCTSASRARGAYKLKRLGPHSPIVGFHYRGFQPIPHRLTCHRACNSQPARGGQHASAQIPQPVRPPSASGRGEVARQETEGNVKEQGAMSRNKGRGAQRHPHWQNPDAKGIPRPAQASGRALGSAPREGPPTPFVYFGLTGARGLQAQASRPSLTDHRLPLPERSTPPSSHGSAPRDKPSTPFVYFGLTGARGLQAQASRPSLTDRRLPLPGLPAHPASPLLSPRLRQSTRTWKATRLRLNPTGQCVRRPPPGRGMSSNRNDVKEQGGRVNKKEGTMGRGNSPTITPAHVGVITVLG